VSSLRRPPAEPLRRFAVLLAAALLTVVVLRSALRAGDSPARGAEVEAVIDGDTVRLRDGSRVRLVQIDAPERGGSECYARAATAELRRLVPAGSSVELELDPELDAEDRYGRRLAYVLRDGENVNIALVRRGAAGVWFFRGERGRYAEALLDAAREARRARRGLWGACPGTALDPLRAIETVR